MKDLKHSILLLSLASGLSATILAIVLTLTMDETNAESHVRLFAICGYLGLFSIVSFFVGLAYPKSPAAILVSDESNYKFMKES